MINIPIILYWILSTLILVTSGMIIYHIWVYYLNRTLAIFTIALFLGVSAFLFLANLAIALKVDWNIFGFLIF